MQRVWFIVSILLPWRTTLAASALRRPWVEGKQYVLLRDVQVVAGQPLVITGAPGYDAQPANGLEHPAILNGIQLVQKASPPPSPPTAAALLNLDFRGDANNVKTGHRPVLEYKVTSAKAYQDELGKKINSAVAEGWDFVSASGPNNENWAVAVLKREKK
jgi:hypothetical protein